MIVTFVRACARSHGRNFFTDFGEISHRRLEPDVKDPFRWNENPLRVYPIFNPILPQIGTYIMLFNGNIETFSGVVCAPIIAVYTPCLQKTVPVLFCE